MRLLICTDLDRTLLPNGPEPESPDARMLFAKLAAAPEIALAYVTGRNEKLVREVIKAYDLPIPDFVLSDVGTSIFTCDGQQWRPCAQWQEAIAGDWNGVSHAEIAELLHDFGDLQLQEESNQNSYKLSYYAPPQTDHKNLLAEMQQRLQAKNINAGLIWSLDEPAGRGLLDLLPACASKLHAIEFLMDKKGYGPENTVFSGDSGNDLPVLGSPIPSILVHNASPEVKREARRLAASLGNEQALYFARGGFRGLNGNYAAGIVEGFFHYHPEIVNFLDF